MVFKFFAIKRSQKLKTFHICKLFCQFLNNFFFIPAHCSAQVGP